MTTRFAVFIATSLDGFIARPDARIDWLERAHATITAGEDCGYAAFMRDVDAMVMGSGTFDTIKDFNPWPYGTVDVRVVSRSMTALPTGILPTVSLTTASPAELARTLRAEGRRKVYVDGGQMIQSFLREGLIDELTITTIPVLIGQGRRLFGDIADDIPLRLTSSQSWSFGFVQSTYEVIRPVT